MPSLVFKHHLKQTNKAINLDPIELPCEASCEAESEAKAEPEEQEQLFGYDPSAESPSRQPMTQREIELLRGPLWFALQPLVAVTASGRRAPIQLD